LDPSGRKREKDDAEGNILDPKERTERRMVLRVIFWTREGRTEGRLVLREIFGSKMVEVTGGE